MERVLTIRGNAPTRPITDFCMWTEAMGPPAKTYYVDGNVSVTGIGTAERPYKTITEAITASNISIALSANRWWARRNRIICCGDYLEEDLVAFPSKCDVIGVGSYDANTKCGLMGTHVPAAEAYGTRWFNMHFRGVAAANPIITLAGASTVSGQQFIGCNFDASLGTVTSAISAVASGFLQVIGCFFYGPWATSYITFGAGDAAATLIEGNRMVGSLGTGIAAGGTTTASIMPVIKDNFIYATGQWVDDDSALFSVINNRAVTAVDCATYTDGFDFNLLLASGNLQTGSNAGDCDSVPHTLFA